MEKILFFNHSKSRCGVYEMGASVSAVLSESKKYNFVSVTLASNSTVEELIEKIRQEKPLGVLYNWHPGTMGWLTEAGCCQVQETFPDLLQGSLVHDAPPPFSDLRIVIYPDPTLREHGIHVRTGRLLQPLRTPAPLNSEVPVIGSFGLGLGAKGFHKVIRQAASEFERSIVRLHLPFATFGNATGDLTHPLVEELRKTAGDRVELKITHDYLSNEDLMQWLTENTINCFFYDEFADHGISSVLDYALAAGRPIALSESDMFRHMRGAKPSIFIKETSLKELISNGIAPLEPYRQKWNAANLLADYERAIDRMRQPVGIDLTPNRVLNAQDRKALQPVIEELKSFEPYMMTQKIPEAVFQNAFNFRQAYTMARPDADIVLVGGYQDPIGPALKKMGHKVIVTDPEYDGRDATDVWSDAQLTGQRWDMVVSCSVLEHVQDDYLFLLQIHQILKPGGVALLTTDFNHDWKFGDRIPMSDVRFYTLPRLRSLVNIFPEGTFEDGIRWRQSIPYFRCDGADYSFCSIMLRNVATPDQYAKLHERILHRMAIKSVRTAETKAQQIRLEHSQLEVRVELQNKSLQEQQDFIMNQYRTIQTLTQENEMYRERLHGIGSRSLKVSLGVARRLSKFKRTLSRLTGRGKTPQ